MSDYDEDIGPTPTMVVVIPDLLGSELKTAAGETVWPDLLLKHWKGYEHDARKLQRALKGNLVVGDFPLTPLNLANQNLVAGVAAAGALRPPHRVVFAPYDWRRAPVAAADDVVKAIQAAGPRSDEQIIIVAHGYGGLVARSLVLKPVTALDKLKAVFFLGAPHRGTPAAVDWLRTGEGLGHLPPLTVVELARDPNFPFATTLIPGEAPWLQSRFTREYNVGLYWHAFEPRADIVHPDQDVLIRKQVLCFNYAGTDHLTPSRAHLRNSNDQRIMPELVGDGRTPVWSALGFPGLSRIERRAHLNLALSPSFHADLSLLLFPGMIGADYDPLPFIDPESDFTRSPFSLAPVRMRFDKREWPCFAVEGAESLQRFEVQVRAMHPDPKSKEWKEDDHVLRVTPSPVPTPKHRRGVPVFQIPPIERDGFFRLELVQVEGGATVVIDTAAIIVSRDDVGSPPPLVL